MNICLKESNKGLGVVEERVVCAANKTTLGLIILGVRHCDEIMVKTARAMQASLDNTEQGFYTNWQRFVAREEAMMIAKEQGQILRPDRTHNPNVLYSECLY